jgi:hypothetical protein
MVFTVESTVSRMLPAGALRRQSARWTWRHPLLVNVMDKLRALQYFVAAADAKSFAGAARKLEVSVSIVHKMVNVLESHLCACLFERSSRGLMLTSLGAAYLDAARPLLEALDELDVQGRSQV